MSTSVSIRTMRAADIPLGMRLKQLAGWNQTEADWRRNLALQPSSPKNELTQPTPSRQKPDPVDCPTLVSPLPQRKR